MTTFETKDIDLAAVIATRTGTLPSILRDFDGQALFEFSHKHEVQSIAIEFATGNMLVDARRLLAIRRRIFHEIRRVAQRESK